MVTFKDLNLSTKRRLLQLAERHGWWLDLKQRPYFVRLVKEFSYGLVKMDVYWNGDEVVTKVGTHMNHPKHGKDKMFRKVSIFNIEKFFINPREHTDGGYGRSKSKK